MLIGGTPVVQGQRTDLGTLVCLVPGLGEWLYYRPYLQQRGPGLGLEQRFGGGFRLYEGHVPRWLPGMSPWKPPQRNKEAVVKDIDRDEVARLTEAYGGAWGINHTRRLLQLISQIGAGLAYDPEIVWLAAHLHDWGGYAHWAQKGVDHAVRSREVAQTFLAERGFPEDLVQPVLACIESHHSGDPGRRIEALLLSDADALDFLGAVGVLRDFSKKPGDLRMAYETVQGRRAKLPGLLCLPQSREIAKKRLQQMDAILAAFEEETSGFF